MILHIVLLVSPVLSLCALPCLSAAHALHHRDCPVQTGPPRNKPQHTHTQKLQTIQRKVTYPNLQHATHINSPNIQLTTQRHPFHPPKQTNNKQPTNEKHHACKTPIMSPCQNNWITTLAKTCSAGGPKNEGQKCCRVRGRHSRPSQYRSKPAGPRQQPALSSENTDSQSKKGTTKTQSTHRQHRVEGQQREREGEKWSRKGWTIYQEMSIFSTRKEKKRKKEKMERK